MDSEPTRIDPEADGRSSATREWATPSLRVHRLVGRFEDAWTRGDRPSIGEYLGEVDDPRDRRAMAIALSAVEIEYRIASGEPANVEEYRARFPELAADPHALREWVASESDARRRAGSPPDPDEYGRRFPELDSSTMAGGFDGLEIVRTLGRGGMGVVYLARHSALKRDVAIKVIHDAFQDDPEALARFRREAEAIAQLRDPGIVQIHELGARRRPDGTESPYLVLEYIPGGPLDRVLDGTPWPPEKAARLVEALAKSVQQAHARGIVHRDLKPSNILLAEDGRPKVADFGLARGDDAGGSALTATGAVLGTPSYMAPEQASGPPRDVGPAADVHALGAILYESLTGRPPYRGSTPLETLDQLRDREPIPPAELQPKVPRDLGSIALKCLEKAPSRRYPNAGALADDLGHFLRGEPTTARPPGLGSQWRRFHRTYPAIARVLAASAVIVPFAAALLVLSSRLERAQRVGEFLRVDAIARDGADAILDGRWREAEKALSDAIDAGHPDPARLRVERLSAYAALGEYDAIGPELEHLASESGADRQEAARLLWEGDMLMGRDNANGTRLIRAAIEKGLPRASDRWYARGMVARTGEEAARAFEFAIDEERFHPRARPSLILTYILMGRKEEARRSLDGLGDRFDEEPGLALGNAFLKAYEGDPADAERGLRDSMKDRWRDGDPRIEAMVAQVRLTSQLAKALPLLAEFGNGTNLKDPSWASLLSTADGLAASLGLGGPADKGPAGLAIPAFLEPQLGWLAFLKEDPRRIADADLDRRIEEATRSDDGASLFLLGMTAFVRRRFDAAEPALIAATRRPSLVDIRRSALNAAINCQGWTLATEPGRAAEVKARSVPILKELMAAGPPPAAWCFNLAQAARRSDQPVIAREIASAWEASGAKPTDVLFLRAQIDFSDGKYARAIRQAGEVMTANPNHPGAKDLIDRALKLRRDEESGLDAIGIRGEG